MRTAAKVAEDYITAWNESDAVRRRALLESTWTSAATYVDPVAKGTGLAEIDTIIGSVQRRFPEFVFSLTGNADGHGDVVRFCWALGPRDGAAVVKGTDFIARQGDKIANVTGFLDLNTGVGLNRLRNRRPLRGFRPREGTKSRSCVAGPIVCRPSEPLPTSPYSGRFEH